jgi:macrolide transport system ATP-binding/permease protein
MSLLRRIANLFSRNKVDREIAAELESHIDMRIADNLACGMGPAEARRDALVRFGNPTVTKERVTGMDAVLLLDSIVFDFRFACRQFLKNPIFSCTAITVLTLGIGASVAIFAFVDAALIKPLPYLDPKRLVSLYETVTSCPHCNVSYQDFLDWKKNSTSFASLDAWGYSNYQLRTSEGAIPVPGVRVSSGFFRTLGIVPVLGRDFSAADDVPSAPHSVLLTYSTWQKRYGGSVGVLGQTIMLSDTSYTIIGILPQEFHFAPRGSAEFWATLHDPNSCELRRACHSLFGIARLKDGVSVEAASAQISLITKQLATQYPDSNRDEGALVMPLGESIVGDIRPILLMLQGGASLLLLIACVNVSSLLLVRAESRKREMAVRSALGASMVRLVRQFTIEGLLLVSSASALGLAGAYVAMRLLLKLVPEQVAVGMPYLHQVGFNVRVLVFAGILMIAAVALFSLAPARRLSTRNSQADLAEGSRGSAGTLWRRFGANLVVVELAVAMVLLVGAGLLGKSLYKLLHVDIGMQPDHLATLLVSTSKAYSDDPKEMALELEILRRMEALPGVKAVAISNELPVRSWDMNTRIRVVGRPWNGERNEVPERDVSPAYFSTLGARLLRGRYFNEAENDPAKPRVAIINRKFASQYFANEDPIGRKIAYVLSKDSIEIVGIVEDIKEGELDSVNRPIMYIPFNQNMWASFNVIVRTSQPEQTLLPTMTAAIHQIDHDLAISNAATMNQLISDSQPAYIHRASAWLVGAFAALALILGVVGLYGVIAYSVSQRTREIGVRMALGAQRRSVYRLILGEAGWLVVLGVAVGLICSVATMTLLRKLLFGLQPWDPTTLVGVSVTLAISAVLASFIPARRAASVNPVEALRAD